MNLAAALQAWVAACWGQQRGIWMPPGECEKVAFQAQCVFLVCKSVKEMGLRWLCRCTGQVARQPCR